MRTLTNEGSGTKVKELSAATAAKEAKRKELEAMAAEFKTLMQQPLKIKEANLLKLVCTQANADTVEHVLEVSRRTAYRRIQECKDLLNLPNFAKPTLRQVIYVHLGVDILYVDKEIEKGKEIA